MQAREILGFGSDPADARRTLTHEVKSRILDRLLTDLSDGGPPVAPQSRYTRSDSGLYGKYEKQADDSGVLLTAISAEIDRMVEEVLERRRLEELGDTQPPAGD